jgi:putative ABC transport system permease protein
MLLLAWRNLIRQPLRFLLTVVGIGFAVFLMMFQGSLLAGFLRAASKVIDTADADIWIAARGVGFFDFPNPIPAPTASEASGVPDVAEVRKAIVGLTFWQRPSGSRKTIVLVGAEPGLTGKLPMASEDSPPGDVVVDASDRAALGISTLPLEVEIGERRARVARSTSGFASFLGSPYVFARYRDAARYLRMGPGQTMFLLVRVGGRRDPLAVAADLRLRFPDLEVWSRDAFSRSAQRYWLLQTGAGGALLTAALLGFVVGTVIASQTMYATTMENLEEFATLAAMGAARRFIVGIVLTQASVAAVLGAAAGLTLESLAAEGARSVVPWIYAPEWLSPAMAASALLMCSLASLASIRKAIAVEPGRVFRA